MLKDKWIKKIVSYGNAIINVSVNAATPETYSSVMMADKFNEVVYNIRSFNEARKKNDGKLSLLLSFVPVQQNVHELPNFIELASELDAGVMVQSLNVLEERHKKLSLSFDSKPERINTFFELARLKAIAKKVPVNIFGPGLIDSTSLYDSKTSSSSSLHPMVGLCYEPWQRLMIGTDGTVTPCCFSGMKMGNVYVQDWLDIWRGERYRDLRRRVNSLNPPEDCLKCPARAGV